MVKSHEYSSNLSVREYEILKLIAEGNSSKQIAFKLNIAEVTVVFHRQNLKKKLDAKNSIELISKAYQLKILY
jgi:two-component system, NarL family, response regulator NreC